MAVLPVSTIVNVSVETAQAGLAEYAVNNLAIVTMDAPIQNYGTGATATATLTTEAISSVTVNTGGTLYETAPPVYVLGGGGSGAVLQATVVDGVVTAIEVVHGGSGYTSVPTLVISSGFGIYNNSQAVGEDFGTSSETFEQADTIFSQQPNITTGGGVLIIYAMNSADTLTTAISALIQQIFFGGVIWAGYAPNNSEIEAGAAVVQALSPPVMLGASSYLVTDLYGSGLFATIQSSTLTQTRQLLYTLGAMQARIAMAAYMSRGMGVNFDGANTTMTMNLKQLTGIAVDPNITSTILAQCQVVGADVYTDIATLPEVISTGGNGYFDNIFNLGWFVGAVQVEVFNYLAQTGTKIPQTEPGMSGLKGAIQSVCQQAVANGFVAPGFWTGSIPFGDPVTFQNNIGNQGYYIYSLPVAQQSQANRNQRQAPPVSVAIKFAGAIQSVQIVVNFQP